MSKRPSASASRPQVRNTAKEARRIRGEIACAECRRLKIRCDRQVPCSTCVSRGCAVLCPNDVLPPGDNSRHVSTATEHLERKLSKMEERMRLLEDALAIAQAQESDQPHPLLAEPFKLDVDDVPPMQVASPGGNVDDLADTLGTLHIDEKDRSIQFFGAAGGAESLLLDEDDKPEIKPIKLQDDLTSEDLRALDLPEELDIFFHSFPFTPIGLSPAGAKKAVESCLPSLERADVLCRILLENLSWMFQIVSLHYLTQELLPAIYIYPTTRRSRDEFYGVHDLALFLICLAIGALVDVTQEPYNAEAQRYYVMARASAGMLSIMEANSLSTVRFLHLLSIYNGMSGKESNLSNTYGLLNLASVMAHRIGLHIDPSHWNLDEKTAYERRVYFWNLIQADLWQSLGTGRPPALANTCGNCRMPTEQEEYKFQQGENPIGFGIWGHKHSKEFMLPLAKCINSTAPPSYRKILEFDKTFRSFIRPKLDDEVTDLRSTSASMRTWVRSHYFELILLFLHRSFFARAITTNPENPLESPYMHSFVTAYQCAVVMLRTTKSQFALFPQLMSRVWQIWTFSFISSVIVGAVACCPTRINLDPPPFSMFTESVELFKDAAVTNSRAAKALPVLLAMHERATRQHEASGSPSNYSRPSPIDRPNRDEAEEIAIFSGKTRLVASSGNPSPPPIPSPSGSQRAPATTLPDFSHWHDLNTAPALPSLSGYSIPQLSLTQDMDQQMPAASTSTGNPHQQWDLPGFTDHQYLPTPSGASDPVDFILDDSWSTFLQNYGALPPPRPT